MVGEDDCEIVKGQNEEDLCNDEIILYLIPVVVTAIFTDKIAENCIHTLYQCQIPFFDTVTIIM